MVNPKHINTEIKDLHTLKTLVQAYQKIAALRMKKTRESVLYSREYLSRITAVFEEVRSSYLQESAKLLRRKGGKASQELTFLAHNGKQVAVLLSANTGLYGEIINKTFRQFTAEVQSSGQVEVTIVGKHGLSLFLNAMPDHPYTYFDLPDIDIKFQDLLPIIKHIVQYEEIHVYYGKYMSFIKQVSSSLPISAEIQPTDQSAPRTSYLFEPSLKAILVFFETEIFASVFEQTVRESSLAKYASRALAMNQADHNISRALKNLQLAELRYTHHLANQKQLNALPGLLSLK